MEKSDTDRFALYIPIRWEVALFVLLFGLAIFLRMYCLSADPPYQISQSTGIDTDPPQYTLFARNAVLTAESNPYNDNRYITYQYSLVTPVSRVVFETLGIGTYQVNLVGVLLSLAAIFGFYLMIRKTLGNGVALLTLLLAAINYVGIFYGRRPFLENGMALLFILGLIALVYGDRRRYGHFLFGVFTAAAIVFGKFIALAFLAAPAAFYLYRRFILGQKAAMVQAMAMVAGMFLVAVIWIAGVYLPHAGEVSGYVGEQAFGLYGYPEGLESFSKFMWKFLVFGARTMFFEQMPMISLGALAALMLVGSLVWTGKSKVTRSQSDHSIVVLLAAWLVGTYLGEMPWNYEPIRYQTVMIFPMAALTAAFLAYLHTMPERIRLFNRSVIFGLILLAGMMVFAYQLTRLMVIAVGGVFTYIDYMPYIAPVVLIVWVIYVAAAWKWTNVEIGCSGFWRYLIIALMVCLSLYIHGQRYVDWAGMPMFTMRQASRDLGMILSPSAVVAGPYAPALSMENDLGCVIHFFGTSRPDSTLFERFPITHLLMDRSNLIHAQNHYPELMSRAIPVCNYNINCNRVWLYHISGVTGNSTAAGYELSFYERAVMYLAKDENDSGLVYLNQFLDMHPKNSNGNLAAAQYALSNMEYDSATYYYKRALDFSLTDFNLHFLLGNAYIAEANVTGDENLRQQGEAEIELARKYSFDRFEFDDYINRSIKNRPDGAADE